MEYPHNCPLGEFMYSVNLTLIFTSNPVTVCCNDFVQRYCNDDVEWYKSVKETQGSVEVTSYGKMNTIFKCGCYIIGEKSPDITTGRSTKDVIRLQLKEKDSGKQLAKKSYSLEELRDLESKLVLITGSNAANRNKVDVFVNVRVLYMPLSLLLHDR